MLVQMLGDIRKKERSKAIAARVHATFTEMIVDVARHIGEDRVVLTGGCFQNRVLLEATVKHLQAAGFRPYWHQRIPPNDGGIALGQVYAAMRRANRFS